LNEKTRERGLREECRSGKQRKKSEREKEGRDFLESLRDQISSEVRKIPLRFKKKAAISECIRFWPRRDATIGGKGRSVRRKKNGFASTKVAQKKRRE